MAGPAGISLLDMTSPGTPLVIVSIVLTFLAATFVSIRVFSRALGAGAIGLDDLFIMVSLVFAVANTIVNCYMVSFGFGVAGAELSEMDLHNALRLFWTTQMLYKVIMGCTKTSIIILYLRVFPGTDVKQFRMICAVVMVYVVGYAIASTLATLAQCTPVARAWDKGIPGTCINMTAFWYSNAVASISGDIIIFLLPLNRIRKLHLPRKQKGQLLFVFCLGGFVCITSVLRMTTLGSASRGLDQTRDTLLSTIWTTVEANTGIICACLPMLRTPLSRVFPRIFLRSSSDHHSPRSPYGLSTGFPARRRLGGSNSLSCGMGGNTRFSGTRIPDGMQQTPYIPKAPAKSSTASSEPITSIPLGAISKTTEVAVSFEDRESGLSSSHEQHEQRLVV